MSNGKTLVQRFEELQEPGRCILPQRPQDRRNDYDVTNRVRVSDASAVRAEVQAMFEDVYPGFGFDQLWLAFYDFDRLYQGRYPGYVGCDTTYHDRQHSLDMTLAMARLIVGFENAAEPGWKLGAERARMGLITSLFHDAGYIRHIERDRHVANGAEFTVNHVSRSAAFLDQYLPHIGLGEDVSIATQIVHFTGYEIDLDLIELDDPRDSFCGHLLGTADLIAQMADRCYLEKCRDRLYAEFVLGGVAINASDPSNVQITYRSEIDLLQKTPDFVTHSAFERLDNAFGSAYRYVESLFDGRNPYLEAIEQNMQHLQRVIDSGDYTLLRRDPPLFTEQDTVAETVQSLVQRKVDEALSLTNDAKVVYSADLQPQ